MKSQAAIRIAEVTGGSALDDVLSVAFTCAKDEAERERHKSALGQELAECGGNRRVFLAYEDDQPVAFIELVLERADNDPELADGNRIAHAHNLQVRKDRQSRGIGTAMMHHLEQVAREMGKREVTLGVDTVNTRARELYDRLGYQLLKEVQGPTPEQNGMYLFKMLLDDEQT